MDGIVAKALAKLLDPPAPANPLADFKTMLETVKELQGISGGSARRSGSMLEEIKGVAELLKVDDADGTIRNLIFGRGDREEQPASLAGSLLRIGEAILTRRPDIIDSGAALLARAASGT